MRQSKVLFIGFCLDKQLTQEKQNNLIDNKNK